MANSLHCREILLVITSSFAQKDFCEREPLENLPSESHAESMARACWNGLLGELLPELVRQAEFSQRLYIADVCQLSLCLLIQMNAIPNKIEPEFTIDPGAISLQGFYN